MRHDIIKTVYRDIDVVFLALCARPSSCSFALHRALPSSSLLLSDCNTCVTYAANDMWSDYLTVYLYAVSDEGYDDDDTVSRSRCNGT